MEWLDQAAHWAPQITGQVALAVATYVLWGKNQEQAKEIAALNAARLADLQAMLKPKG